MKYLATFLVVSPLLAWAGGVRGRFGAPDIGRVPNVTARLISIGPALEVRTAPVGPDGVFYFPAVNPGSFVLEGEIGGTRLFFRVVRVSADEELDTGTFLKDSLTCEPPDCFADDFGFRPPPTPPRIVDVCSALEDPQRFLAAKIVIVGSLQETAAGPQLVGHCQKQLASGGYSWMNAIGLPGLSTAGPLDLSQVQNWNKISEPDKQLSRIAAAARKHDRRPAGRVVAVYGRLSPQFGLEVVRCRHDLRASDIQYPPEDLIDIQFIREMK